MITAKEKASCIMYPIETAAEEICGLTLIVSGLKNPLGSAAKEIEDKAKNDKKAERTFFILF